jgi:hypothetical protein
LKNGCNGPYPAPITSLQGPLKGGAIGVHERGSGVVFSRCVAGSLPARGTLSRDAALRLLVSIKACAYNMPPGAGKGQEREEKEPAGTSDRYAITL